MIIKPQGRPIRRITIEMDSNGQAKCEAVNLQFATGVPMAITEVALILGQVLVTVIQSLDGQAKPQIGKNADKETAKADRHDV